MRLRVLQGLAIITSILASVALSVAQEVIGVEHWVEQSGTGFTSGRNTSRALQTRSWLS